MIEQSGLDLTPQTLAGHHGGGRRSCLARSSACSRQPARRLVAAVIGSLAPAACTSHKGKARLEKLLAQLPDAFDLMARVIRAGQTMSQALLAVADEFPPPIAAEFAYCYEQQNLGLPPEVAMRDLARRTGLLEIKIFVLACWSSSRPAATLPSCSTSSPPSSASVRASAARSAP